MRKINLIADLIEVMYVTTNDLDISYNEIKNVYTNLRKKEPELFINKNEEGNKQDLSIIKKADKQYRYRSYVRTVFSCIEGFNNSFEKITLFEYKKSDKSTKVKALKDYERLTSNKKISFQDKIKHSLRLGSIVLNSGFIKVIFSDNNWQNFNDAVDIRHRVTHPKTKIDFKLSKKEILIVNRANDWIFEQITRLIYPYK